MDLSGRDFLFCTTRPAVAESLRVRFDRVESEALVPVAAGGRTLKTYRVLRCRGLRDAGMFKP
jgi:hypothetical protein